MKKIKFSIDDIKCKLSRIQMKDVLGGSGFPDALCEVVCSDDRVVGTNQCSPVYSGICGSASIISCTCK